jgi:hypothetical protein
MFVLTPEGVTATDPISYGRPQAATTYTTPNNLVTAHLPLAASSDLWPW